MLKSPLGGPRLGQKRMFIVVVGLWSPVRAAKASLQLWHVRLLLDATPKRRSDEM